MLQEPRKITVTGPPMCEVTKRKNPKIRDQCSQGLSPARLCLEHRWKHTKVILLLFVRSLTAM